MSFEITVSDDDTVNGTIEISSNMTIVEGTKALCRIFSPLMRLHIKPKASGEIRIRLKENRTRLLILQLKVPNLH